MASTVSPPPHQHCWRRQLQPCWMSSKWATLPAWPLSSNACAQAHCTGALMLQYRSWPLQTGASCGSIVKRARHGTPGTRLLHCRTLVMHQCIKATMQVAVQAVEAPPEAARLARGRVSGFPWPGGLQPRCARPRRRWSHVLVSLGAVLAYPALPPSRGASCSHRRSGPSRRRLRQSYRCRQFYSASCTAGWPVRI